MKRKPFHLCREFECPNPTWSGRPEKDPELRYCSYHSPEAKLQHAKFLPKMKPLKIIKKPKLNPFFLSLICVFREFREIRNKVTWELERVIFTQTEICGKHAPRRLTGDRSQPRHPNRFGEPLCPKHAMYALNESAFPGSEGVREVSDERQEEHDAKIAVMTKMLEDGAREIERLHRNKAAKP